MPQQTGFGRFIGNDDDAGCAFSRGTACTGATAAATAAAAIETATATRATNRGRAGGSTTTAPAGRARDGAIAGLRPERILTARTTGRAEPAEKRTATAAATRAAVTARNAGCYRSGTSTGAEAACATRIATGLAGERAGRTAIGGTAAGAAGVGRDIRRGTGSPCAI
ncbi:MAG: hypothetical protein J0H30_11375 [Alphaproteobacteria bacterium]|nr:hypothetical protein [Alphaproteobacteria bacterium]